VSLGPPLVPLPTDLVGLPLPEAQARLEAAELTLGEVTPQYDETVPADVVMQLGAELDAELPKGTEVPLIVSAGPEPRTIPAGLVGTTADAATDELRALGLEVTRVSESSEEAPVGQVLGVRPSSGTQVARGSTVELVVSSGPPVVPVPDVSGKTAAEAAQILQAQGFTVSGTQGSPANRVTGTNPAAGTVVRKGSSVTIVTS
jgi:serine/threonine-protein kinase